MQKKVEPGSSASARGPGKRISKKVQAAELPASSAGSADSRGRSPDGKVAEPMEPKESSGFGVQQKSSAENVTFRKDEDMAQPFIIDLGSVSRKEIKRLKRGTGVKLEEVLRATQEARVAAPEAPIIVLYRKKKKRSRSLFPFPFSLPN